MEEAKLLPALDFLGEIATLLCQPFWLRFFTPDEALTIAPKMAGEFRLIAAEHRNQAHGLG
ncbi:hypothetical protein AB0M44_42425 [Streptosporangium subroseum]|uniref:hypothetical protein n=1 Tax=Streptosporangium subroseum TaxID=106412 RepID=UPI0034196CA4